MFVENCFQCHSETEKGNLRLDSRHGMMSGAIAGPAIMPGQPDDSRLMQAIHYGDELQMPPKGKLNERANRSADDVGQERRRLARCDQRAAQYCNRSAPRHHGG